MLKIDKDTYVITEKNRYKTRIAKTQIVLATSMRKDHNHILRLQHKDYGKTKKWNTFTISRTGEIYQHFEPVFHTDFLGNKEIDKKIISIVLENMGALFQPTENKYVNWLNEVCDNDDVEEKAWSGYKFWEKFPEKQIESTAFLCKQLCDEFNIPPMLIEFHHYNKEIHKFRGIVFRSNYIEDSSDINPLFNIDYFNGILNNTTI